MPNVFTILKTEVISDFLATWKVRKELCPASSTTKFGRYTTFSQH